MDLAKHAMKHFEAVERTDAFICFDGTHVDIHVDDYPPVDHAALDAYLFEKSGHRIVTRSDPMVNTIDVKSLKPASDDDEEEDLNDMTAFTHVYEMFKPVIRRFDGSLTRKNQTSLTRSL